MGALMRAHDWAASGLGPTDHWPQSLRTVIRLMLNTGHPMYVFWGPEGCCFYNDAYRQSIGAERHPGSLGRPAREVWDEIWPIIGPQIDQVMSGGGATWNVNALVPITRDGVYEDVYWTYSYSPIDDEGAANGIGGVLVLCSETTEAVESARKVADSETRLQQALSAGRGIGTWDWNVTNDQVVADARFARLYGADPERARTGAPLAEFFTGIHPDDAPRVQAEIAETLATGQTFSSEYRLVQPDGEHRWVLAEGSATLVDGAPVRMAGVTFDITEARATREALRDSEQRYRTLFDSVGSGFCIIQMKFDADLKPIDYMIVEGNAAFEAMTGLTDAAGKWVSEIAPGLEQHWFDLYGGVALTGETVRFENRADFFGRWYDVEALRLGEPEARRVAVVFNDITARKRLEARQAALIELDAELSRQTEPSGVIATSSRLLAKALGAYRAGYGDVDPEAETIVVADDWIEPGGRSVAGTHHFRAYGSYIADTIQGRPVTIGDVTTDPRTRADPAPLLAYGIQALMDVPVMENGRMVAQVLVHSAAPRAWTEGDVDLARAFAARTRAVVSRRKAEQETRSRESELQRLADSIPLLVSFVDSDERYGFANRAYTDWFGAKDDLIGRPVRDVIGDDAYGALKPQIDRALSGERFSTEQRVNYVGAGPRDMRADFIPRHDETGAIDGYYAIVQDVGERKQAQLRQSVLLELNDAIRDLTDPAEIEHASSRILAETLGVSRVGYGVMDTVAETVTIARDYNAPGVQSIAGVIHFRDFGTYIDELARGETVIFADAAKDPRVQDGGVALAGIRATSLINMPLIERGKVVALLFVNNASPREWSDEDMALVREVAERVRTASERARVTTSLLERERRLMFLDALAQATQSLTDADAILATTTRMTAEHLDVSNCAYADMDQDEDGFNIRGDWAAPGSPSIVGHYQLADFGVLAVRELGAGRPLIINDNLTEIAPEEAATFQAIGIAATICMPLVKDGRLTALMAIHAAVPHVWNDYELSLIREVTERSWAHIERVRSLAEQRESEARYRTLFDTVDEGFCIIELIDGPHGPLSDYVHVETNPAAAEQVGLAGVAGKTIRELAPDQAQEWVDIYRSVLETGEPIRLEKLFEQTSRWLEVAAFRIEPESRNQVAVLFKDLTERKTAELALRESEAQFRAFAQAVPNHVWASRPDGHLYWFNEAVYAYAGLSEGQIDGAEGWGRIVHPDDLADAAETWGRALATGESYRTEFRIRRADGEWRRFTVNAEPVRDIEGAITGWVGANLDIEDIRQQGEELERVNDILSSLLSGSQAERDRLWELSPDLLTVVDYEGNLQRVNPSWTRVLGYDEETLLGRPYAAMLHPDELDHIAEVLTRMRATEQPTLLEDRLLAADGTWRSFVWTLSPEPGGERLYGVGRDVTEERARADQLAQAQEALRQSQKMEAVGQLTGGIAHDFNNLLAGISGSLELLGKRLSEGRLNGMERYIDAAQGSAQRAASLTQRLLAFSRRQTLDPKPTDVNRLINGMEDLIRRSVGPNVELEVVGAGGLWASKIDQSQLENALLNLCINARDAMAPGGGRLTIETSNKWLDDRAAKDRDLTPGQYVSLCVTDTGTGMPPEVQAQAFDPFFTTKPLGQGTGLGLSMIHGFVRQSGGQVRIYSEIGKGTTLCLYLPRYQGDVDADEDVGATPVVEGGHGETVLIIDDEETVRMLVAEVLGEAGYNVIEAPDGPSGLEILRSDRRIDLLVSDVGLPGGMNGRQVADAARVTRPDLKVLFITGYAENAAVGNGLLAPGMEVLTKPFVMGDLAAKVHDMMEA